MKNNSSAPHEGAKARRREGTNVETHGVRLNVEAHAVRLKIHPLWIMRNVLKGRNFHNRRSTTCGSLSIASSV
ncbi:MAG: hypothetical protein LBF89_02050 [Bacteroidales bacterium]|jgi:hypothetical protein|nr:hypothetical protein [Bacteroidales bacterium]